MSPGEDSGPNLLLDWTESSEPRRFLRAGIGSFLTHMVLFALAFAIGSLDVPIPPPAPEVASNLRVTPLIAPPTQLTQRAPNKGKVNKEINIGNLMPREARPPAPVRPTRSFQPPLSVKTPSPDIAPTTLPEAPRLDVTASAHPNSLPPIGVPNAPPPQIQAEEKPKLRLETPGEQTPVSGTTLSKLVPPKTSVEDAVKSVARGAGRSPVIVGDLEPPPTLNGLPPSPGYKGAQLELLSDPQGVDFRPYLIRIVALVRRNWLAVVPESAKLGARGLVQLMFSIDRSGQVPKLVIATPSGMESLDRAAVAGISATVPFPPLPPEYKGQQIRLQLSFKYNMR